MNNKFMSDKRMRSELCNFSRDGDDDNDELMIGKIRYEKSRQMMSS
jgi:hypothetical protein